MLDAAYIRENPDKVEKACRDKGVDCDVKRVLELDETYRKRLAKVEEARAEQNRVTKERQKGGQEEARKLKDAVKKEERGLKKLKEELDRQLYEIPNIPLNDVPVGKDEAENEEVKVRGEVPEFGFAVKDHEELGESLDVIDIARAAKVSGTRFGYLKNEAVLLEFALVRFAFDTLLKEKFVPVVPPVLLRPSITRELGYWQAGGNEDYYLVFDPAEKRAEGEYAEFYLAGTAEHALVPMHQNETLAAKELPKRYVGFSTSFRREAGSYGRDTRGIFRVHQFDKVEMVSLVPPERGEEELDHLLSLQEKLFGELEIPYRVVKMCTGDLGFPAAKKFDIEAWIPSQKRYREVTSVSTTTDFQARRLNIRYQQGGKKEYVHILNGTGFAIGRTLAAILENCQQRDGSVKVPKVLQKYAGIKEICR